MSTSNRTGGPTSSLSRKQFLALLAGAAAGLTAGCSGAPAPGASAAGTGPGSLPRRRLGRTGETLPVLGLGGHHLGRAADEATAGRLVEAALEEGVRFFDTAQAYQGGRSERWLGRAIRDVRGEVFLMTKTHDFPARSREGAKRHLGESLERLGTDRLDLWQLHQIETPDDVDRAFAPGGAMETLFEMRDAGVVRFVGVTGHTRPSAHLRAIEHFDRGLHFDTVQLPINPIDFHQLSFQREVLPGLVERDIGVIAMKTVAWGALPERGVCTVEECLRFAYGLPIGVAVSGMTSIEQVRENARLARATPMDAGEMEALLARIEGQKDLALEWYKSA